MQRNRAGDKAGGVVGPILAIANARVTIKRNAMPTLSGAGSAGMTSVGFSRDSFASAAPGSEDICSPYEEEADEGEANAAYGSLLGLGKSLGRKASFKNKRPALVLDPEEAEIDARRVQFVAVQQFVGSDDPGNAAFLDDLADLAKYEAVEAPAVEIVAEADAFDEPSDAATRDYWPDPEDAPPPVREDGDDFWIYAGAGPAPDDAVEAMTEGALEDGSDERGPLAADWLPDDEPVAESVALASEEPIAPPPASPSRSARAGHSLRTRVPQARPRKTFGDRLVAFLAWCQARFGRGGDS